MENDGLIFGYHLNGENKSQQISWGELNSGISKDQCIWLHFDYTHPKSAAWISEQSHLDPLISEALLNEETRPRANLIHQGLLLSLRGINLIEGADPEDMVAIRVWIDGNHIISTRKRRLLSASDIAAFIDRNEGPETPGEFVALLTERLIVRMKDTINDTEDRVDLIEEKTLITESYALRSEIVELRRGVISLRRYLAPQRDAMLQLQSDKINIFSVDDRSHIRETTDHLIRYIEDLDSVRDRAALTQEELVNRLSEQLNSRMYVLSIVAAIFLPLGFLTGLLGINVGGIPGAENPYAFWIFLGGLIVLVGFQAWLFKVKRWF